MFGSGALTFQEFMTGEKLPLARIQASILEFLRGRKDAVLFGAQAVNAYVDEPRMTQDIDLLSPRASELAEELRRHLQSQFHIAVRIRKAAGERGFRLYQIRKSGNRHLVDLRVVKDLPPAQRIAGVLVVAPEELIAEKVVSYRMRRGKPKSGTDWRDLAMLLLAFPKLKSESGAVAERLKAAGAGPEILAAWKSIVSETIIPSEEDDEF